MTAASSSSSIRLPRHMRRKGGVSPYSSCGPLQEMGVSEPRQAVVRSGATRHSQQSSNRASLAAGSFSGGGAAPHYISTFSSPLLPPSFLPFLPQFGIVCVMGGGAKRPFPYKSPLDIFCGGR